MSSFLLRARFVGLLLLPAAVATAAAVALSFLRHPDFQLLRWDALWYDSIRAGGYRFVAHAQCNTGFFPLFPYLWRGLGLSAGGMALLNFGLMVGALLALARGLRLWPPAVLLFAALPTSVFFCLPYSEALFFAAASGVLLGLARQRPAWVAGSLLLAALIRPTALYLLPALLAVGYQRYYQQLPGQRRAVVLHTLLYMAAAAAGIGAVLLEQWRTTGVWLAYIRAQMEWDHLLKLPQLPFVSVSQGVLLLDGLALLAAVAAGGWAVRQLWCRRAVAPVRLFAAVYVAAAALHLLLHAPLAQGHTSLISLNRYLLASPFALVLLDAFLPRQRPPWQLVAAVALAVLALAAALGLCGAGSWVFGSLRGQAVPTALLLLPLLTYALAWTLSGYRPARMALYGAGVLLQALLLRNFLLGYWVG